MKRMTAFILAGVLALLVSMSAFALDIGAAKQQGLVGETDTGYIAPVSSPSADVTALVNSVNAQRKKVYQDLATKNNVPLAEVEKLGAKKAIEKTPSGQKVRVGGSWQTK
jgi:uncharacterized protein